MGILTTRIALTPINPSLALTPKSTPSPLPKRLTQLLHQRSIPQTNSPITQSILSTRWFIPRLSPRLIRNAQNLISISRNRIDKVRAFNNEGLNRKNRCRIKRDERKLSRTRRVSFRYKNAAGKIEYNVNATHSFNPPLV